MKTIVLIDSKNDDTICARDFDTYSRMMFEKITSNRNGIIPFLKDRKVIPPSMDKDDYFIIKTILTPEKSPKDLGYSQAMTLCRVVEAETGWVRSVKVKKGKELKLIRGTVIDLFEIDQICESCEKSYITTDYKVQPRITEFFSSQDSLPIPVQYQPSPSRNSEKRSADSLLDSRDSYMTGTATPWLLAKEGEGQDTPPLNAKLFSQMSNIPKNWKKDLVAKHFVDNICTIDEITKSGLTSYLTILMRQCEQESRRKDKEEIALKIFNKLATPDGKRFTYSHWRFHKTCRERMIHFYNVDGFEAMAPLFEEIFGTLIPSNI